MVRERNATGSMLVLHMFLLPLENPQPGHLFTLTCLNRQYVYVCAYATKIRRHSCAADCGSSPRLPSPRVCHLAELFFLPFLPCHCFSCFCFGVNNIHCTFPPSRRPWGIAHILPRVFLVVAEASRKKCVLEGGFARRSRAWDLIFQFTFSQLCNLG